MNAQRRRALGATDANNTLNSNTADNITLLLDESDVVNVHGMHYCFSIEPEVENANANGWWALWCLPANTISPANLPDQITNIDDEDANPYLWGLGCWTASNQAPFHLEFAPRTSRNCQKGARIVGVVNKSGVSAGSVRIIQTLTCFTSS